MLPVERREQIKQLIQEHEHMKISELSQKLNVSEMTIHRDLKPLIDKGYVLKTFGGVTFQKQKKPTNTFLNSCVICQRPINERIAYRIILKNNQTETACCAHCGLIRHQQIADEIAQDICQDFLTQTTINSRFAWYVMDTSIHIGCCQPQILTFESKEYADKFIKGFGGKVYSFNEALEVVLATTNHACHHHS